MAIKAHSLLFLITFIELSMCSAHRYLTQAERFCSIDTSCNDTVISLLEPEHWTWLINDTADTTVGASDCSYDRIVINVNASIALLGPAEVMVESAITKAVSDHFPVEVTFAVDTSPPPTTVTVAPSSHAPTADLTNAPSNLAAITSSTVATSATGSPRAPPTIATSPPQAAPTTAYGSPTTVGQGRDSNGSPSSGGVSTVTVVIVVVAVLLVVAVSAILWKRRTSDSSRSTVASRTNNVFHA